MIDEHQKGVLHSLFEKLTYNYLLHPLGLSQIQITRSPITAILKQLSHLKVEKSAPRQLPKITRDWASSMFLLYYPQCMAFVFTLPMVPSGCCSCGYRVHFQSQGRRKGEEKMLFIHLTLLLKRLPGNPSNSS